MIAAGNRSVNKYFSQASREGVNGEIGLALLQSPVGKLSGKESKASIGVEMRVGRQGFSYEVEYDIPDPHPYRIENKSNWVKLMGRFGWRLLFGKRFFVDSGLPIGLQLGTIKVTQTDLITGDQTVYRSSPKGLAVLPSLAIGCRF
ncbi:MAG: hypothetical protein IPK76_07500 [Lewinellaceae bacterium]|nr:hypothetical protein [Lewinellaceae bacterium]